jgi:hypothetical protein
VPAKEPIHEGKQSWWDGTWKTLCGLKFEKARTYWFVSEPTCTGCLAAKQKK